MSSAPTLDRLDAQRGGPFTYRHGGDAHTLPDPADLTFEEVLTILDSGMILPPYGAPLFKAEALFRRWVAHYDLLDFPAAQRLCFSVNRYADALDWDLRVHAHMDLGEMWRSRRWRTLLATIDRLPRHSYHAEAVSQDPEHARKVGDYLAEQEEDEDSPATPSKPALRTWTPEVEVLTHIKDGVRRVEWAVFAAQHGKKVAGEPPDFSPGPVSLLEDARKAAIYRKRMAKHKSLTQRLLPHKRDE